MNPDRYKILKSVRGWQMLGLGRIVEPWACQNYMLQRGVDLQSFRHVLHPEIDCVDASYHLCPNIEPPRQRLGMKYPDLRRNRVVRREDIGSGPLRLLRMMLYQILIILCICQELV